MPPIRLTFLGKRGLQGNLAYRGIYSCSLPYAFAAAFYTTKYSSLARFLQEYHAGQTMAFPTIYSLRGENVSSKWTLQKKGDEGPKAFYTIYYGGDQIKTSFRFSNKPVPIIVISRSKLLFRPSFPQRVTVNKLR
jgi:hypothetical protein